MASSIPSIRSLGDCGRVLVLGTPPEAGHDPRGGDRPARAGGLHALARQGAAPRRHRAARLCGARRRGSARRDRALPALAALCLRLGTGRAHRAGRAAAGARLGTAAERQGGARHRRLARHRRGDRRHARPRRRACGRPRRAGAARRPRSCDVRARRLSITLDITAEAAPAEIAAQLRAAHGGVDVVVHNAGITRDKTLGRMDAERWDSVIDVNLCARAADHRRAIAEEALRRRRARGRRVLDQRDRRQRGPEQLRDLQGRRDRLRRRLCAAARKPRQRRSTPSPPASSRRR